MDANATKLLLSIPEAMASTSLGRTKIYELIGNGALETVTLGRRRMIPAEALHTWVERLRSKCRGQV